VIRKKKGKAAYMISVVAETYGIHPQTLRLYEREGLLKPSRSEGNTRLYTEEDLERLELILNLTRDLGVNLAGVEVVMNMRRRMQEMQREMQEFIQYIEREMTSRSPEMNQKIQHALVKVTPAHVVLAKPRNV
jgi:MerR family transcriptional regulator/heat shock protein HspR